MWKDPKRKKEYQKVYYLRNKKKLIKQNKEWHRKDYKKNPEKYHQKSRDYFLKNPERYRAYRRNYRKFNPNGIWSVLKESSKRRDKNFKLKQKSFARWWNKQIKECFYCGVSIENLKKLNDSMSSWCDRLSVDRLNNKNSYSLKNIVLACRRCNSIKGDFFSWQEMKEIGEKYIKPKRNVSKRNA